MLRCESPGEMQFERGEHCKHQLKARVGEAVIEFFVDMGRVGSGVGEAGGGGINPAAGVIELEPACIRRYGCKEGLGRFFSKGPGGAIEQLQDNEACSGCRRIEQLNVAETVGCCVMVDYEDWFVVLL